MSSIFCHFYTFYSQLIATKNTLRIFNSQCAFLIAVLLFIQFINSLIITIVPIDISQPLPHCFATLSAKSNAIRYNITSAFITKSLIISLFLNLCHGYLAVSSSFIFLAYFTSITIPASGFSGIIIMSLKPSPDSRFDLISQSRLLPRSKPRSSPW